MAPKRCQKLADDASGDGHESISSADTRTAPSSAAGAQCSHALKRADTYPLPHAPPKRPSRSTSVERQGSLNSSLTVEESEDEIDHYKFRQLLLGVLASADDDEDTANNGSGDSNSNAPGTYLTPPIPILRHRKSTSSAPPKLPNRVGSDSEKDPPRKGACPGRRSLPCTPAFRPTPVRRRRRRSRIQEMLSPDSEESSKSLRLPPRRPSRTGSGLSNTGNTRGEDSANPLPNVLVLRSSSSAASIATACSSSQKSLMDAPKRPRRSASPDVVETFRLLAKLDSQEDQTDSSTAKGKLADDVTEKPDAQSNIPPLRVQSADNTNTDNVNSSNGNKRRRNLPLRARTFSFSGEKLYGKDYYMTASSGGEPGAIDTGELSASHQGTCLGSLLSMNFRVGRDFKGGPVTSSSSLDFVPGTTTTTGPNKAPQRRRVTPGRSRTFSSAYLAETSIRY